MLRTGINFVSVKTVSDRIACYLSHRYRYLEIRPMASEASPDRERDSNSLRQSLDALLLASVSFRSHRLIIRMRRQKDSLSTGNFESSKVLLGWVAATLQCSNCHLSSFQPRYHAEQEQEQARHTAGLKTSIFLQSRTQPLGEVNR
jgi:hypothetical protein